MRLSKYVLPTLKEVPSDAVVTSHILMLRAGMIRKLAAGIYSYLPLGLKVIRKIERIIREEMDATGAVELLMPSVQPAEIWVESGRWGYYGPELLRFKDRKNAEYCLGPTHEEVITDIVRNVLPSYRNIPITLYQIQNKFRDEIRPRFGLLRGREFIMKDAYSFDMDKEGAYASYEKMDQAYRKIFTRCGLKFKIVEAGTGAIGGTRSHEFQVIAQNGEDMIMGCSICDYAANIEKAECIKRDMVTVHEPYPEVPAPEEVHTPGKKTIEEVAGFLNSTKDKLIKTLIYTADGNPVALLIRGDHELAEAKAAALLQCDEFLPADEKTILSVTGGPVGFSGPISLKIPVPLYADYDVAFVEAGVVGGNKGDIHIKNIWPSRDFPSPVKYLDLRLAIEGEGCPRCGKGKYIQYRGIEAGQLFYLGTKYSSRMNAYILDEHGEKRPLVMGCYGIGVTRAMASAIEQNHDDNGIIWPMSIAPFQAIICPLGREPAIMETAIALYEEFLESHIETLFDDRGERAGVMFKDADLIGIPIRINVGKKGIKDGRIEVKLRWEKEPEFIPADTAALYVKDLIQKAMR